VTRPPPREPLPVDAVLGDLVGAVRDARGAVLVAPTGSGKTTRVPPALLDASGGEVWLVEPRRIAARAAARRIAEERGGRLGDEVGYSVRFERVGGTRTRLWCVTEGILLRRLVDDPFLEGVSAVVFDEFHERRLDSDLALALCRRVRSEVRPDLALIGLSATLDAGPLAAFLDAPSLISEGRRFPVDVRHVPAFASEAQEDTLARALELELRARGKDRGAGDVLVFLPGVGEIRRASRRLATIAANAGFELAELYGELPPQAQDRLFAPGPRPRIVLATNVAQTSITLPRVVAVIDSGTARSLRHDPGTGLDRLVLGPISRAAADQRAGRAGRTAPGRAWRLWSAPEHRSLAEHETAEIHVLDLSGALLSLVAFGESKPRDFPWFEAPPVAAVDAALELLGRLGALDTSSSGLALTPLGRTMAALPLHPRLARLLIAGAHQGVARETALAAALLAERDPFRRAARELGADPFADALDSDLFERVRALEAFERGQRSDADPGAADAVLRAADRLMQLVPRSTAGARAATGHMREEGLARALLAAYPDRVARRREPGSPRARLVGGRGAVQGRESRVSEAELFVAIEVDGGPRAAWVAPGGHPADALVRQASAIEADWLDPRLIRTADDVRFDAERGRAVAMRQTLYLDLPLVERPVPPTADDTARLLGREVARDPGRALGLARPHVEDWLARVEFLARHCPELELPVFDATLWGSLAEELVAGAQSSADLLALPLVDILGSKLTREQRGALEREAPESVVVPAGRRAKLEYPRGRAPFLAARIQELFGLAAGPRLARGRVPLVVHLLAPNGRPQQVTDDLASFWANTYPLVRRELKPRYPRHAWPDDPATATPTSRPRPRGR